MPPAAPAPARELREHVDARRLELAEAAAVDEQRLDRQRDGHVVLGAMGMI